MGREKKSPRREGERKKAKLYEVHDARMKTIIIKREGRIVKRK